MSKQIFSPINLCIVRHAETKGMKEGIRLGNDDPISSKGYIQSKKLARRLQNSQFDCIYTSPTLRSKQTLEEIKKTCQFKQIIEYSGLVERKEATSFVGVKTEHMPWDLIKRNRLKRKWRFEDAESYEDIYDRASEVLLKFQSHKYGSNILAISHGSFTRALFAVILLGEELTPRKYFLMTEKLFIGATGLTKLEYSKKYYEDSPSWKIITWMDTSHLDK